MSIKIKETVDIVVQVQGSSECLELAFPAYQLEYSAMDLKAKPRLVFPPLTTLFFSQMHLNAGAQTHTFALPVELYHQIILFLDVKDIITLRKVTKGPPPSEIVD